MTLGFAMFAATFMVAVVAAIMAVCYALVWLLSQKQLGVPKTVSNSRLEASPKSIYDQPVMRIRLRSR